ncbi:hypothetical protein L209DRAFT_754922 [Thermothelomyces heterothallicus CBS 203.75]
MHGSGDADGKPQTPHPSPLPESLPNSTPYDSPGEPVDDCLFQPIANLEQINHGQWNP